MSDSEDTIVSKAEADALWEGRNVKREASLMELMRTLESKFGTDVLTIRKKLVDAGYTHSEIDIASKRFDSSRDRR